MAKSLNDLTPEELQEIQNLGGLLFTPREVALMMQVPVSDVLIQFDMESGNFYESFQTGRLQAETDLRKAIMQLARAGSSPAQTMAIDILNKSTAKMLDR